ncbi:MAG: GNAT family N-acetyltransferase [Verrucomicrobiia bacterium]
MNLKAAPMLSPAGIHIDNGSLQRVNPLEETGWDAMLQSYPSSSIFHTAAWARVLHATYGYTPVYFTLRESGVLQALLPLMEVNSWLTGKRGVSLPFTDDCEPICVNAGALGGLLKKVMEYAEDRGWKYLECRGGREFFAGAPASTAFYGHRLILSGGEEAIFTRVESSVRRAIRKAEKGGISIEFAQSLDAMRTFYYLHCKTRNRHGLPPQPFRFFQNIHDCIMAQNRGFVVLARHQQTPVASAVYFHWGKNAIYKYGASDEAFQHLRANNLVMWEAIKWYEHNHFQQLHFGRTSLTNQGLRRFKLGWGTEEHSIEYVRYDRRKDGFVTVKDESSGWYSHVFSKMPGFMSRLAGALLYKHMA